MIKQRDPLSKPPASEGSDEFLRWWNDDLAAFQASHPDAPQGLVRSLSDRQRKQLLIAWNSARDAAALQEAKAVSHEYHRSLERAQRTGVISATATKPKKKNPRR